jgi:hypothetical protein
MAGADQVAFFQQQARLMSERAAFFQEQQDDLDGRVAQFEDAATCTPFGVAETRAFCAEKAGYFQHMANVLTERLASALKEIEDTKQCFESVDGSVPIGDNASVRALLQQQADELQREADTTTDRVAFLLQEAEAMKARVEFCDEAASQDAQAFFHERRVFLQKEAQAFFQRAAFFQREADSLKERAQYVEESAVEEDTYADADRVAFFEEAEKTAAKKQKRGLFGFLRRKKGKEAAVKVVETAKTAAADAKSAADEARKLASQTEASIGQSLSKEISTGSERWEEWRAYVKEEQGAIAELVAPAKEELAKLGFEVEGAVKSEETKAEKAIKKRGFFGFLRRKNGKDGKTKARKAKKGRVQAKAPKKGLFGFLRRKKAVEEDGTSSA